MWDVVEDGSGDYYEDRRAMSVRLWAVPPKLMRTFGVKNTTNKAWDTFKIIQIEVAHVWETRAQTWRMDFENLTFKDSDGVDSFNILLMAIVKDLEVLGDPITENKAVLKFLRSVPQPYK